MQVYKIFDMATGAESRIQYAGSMNDAHTHAKFIASRPDVRIELLEVPTDKAAVLLYLNGEVSFVDFKPLRTWSLTERGGLKEIANGE